MSGNVVKWNNSGLMMQYRPKRLVVFYHSLSCSEINLSDFGPRLGA